MTRMWCLPTNIMCNAHIGGEWKELFMIVGNLRKKRSIRGYIEKNCIEVSSIIKRYNELKQEKLKRGHKQFKELPEFDYSYLPLEHQEYTVDREASLTDLLGRCEKCRERFEEVCA